MRPQSIYANSLLLVVLSAPSIAMADASPSVVHQVTGLFCQERVSDLQEVCKSLPDIELKRVDFDRSEAHFVYDPAKAFPNTKPEKVIERFDQVLRNASRHTFGIKPVCADHGNLQRVEIKIAGLDCKGCSFAAYDAVYRLPGVEYVTASFRDGLVIAWIHASKTKRATLVQALMKRGIKLTTE